MLDNSALGKLALDISVLHMFVLDMSALAEVGLAECVLAAGFDPALVDYNRLEAIVAVDILADDILADDNLADYNLADYKLAGYNLIAYVRDELAGPDTIPVLDMMGLHGWKLDKVAQDISGLSWLAPALP